MHHANGNANGCGCEPDPGTIARNHYFTGKLLVERDFTDEQRYHVGKQRRHNRTLHGWGAVCGLRVVEHPTPACRARYVIVEPGVAVDCCGREIVVPRREMVDVEALVEGAELGDEPHRLQLCVRYRECPAEEIPALFDDCGCDPDACAPNRIVESYAFDVLVDAPPQPRPEPPDDCAELLEPALDGCPECPDETCVVLATVVDYSAGDELTGERIDNRVDRRVLHSTERLAEAIECLIDRPEPEPEPEPEEPEEPEPEPEPEEPEPPPFTRICGINWAHSGRVEPDATAKHGLVVAFDGRVRSEDLGPQTVLLLRARLEDDARLRCWCEVPHERIGPVKLETSCAAETAGEVHDEPETEAVSFLPAIPLEPGEYRVLLKGDFIRASDGRAIDADHLPGWLPDRPSGDGVEGGTFESWFQVVGD